jgi:hypothetical protein
VSARELIVKASNEAKVRSHRIAESPVGKGREFPRACSAEVVWLLPIAPKSLIAALPNSSAQRTDEVHLGVNAIGPTKISRQLAKITTQGV